jgi:drug/metabolite transporter (DMT)-like permease
MLHKKVIAARTQGRATQVNILLFVIPKFLNLFAICLFGMAYSYTVEEPIKNSDIEWLENIIPKFYLKKRWLAVSFESDVSKPYLSFESSFVLLSSSVFILVVISKVFLGRKQYRHQWSSLLVMFGAVLMVVIPYLVDEQNSVENAFIGIAMVFSSILLISIQYAFEEWLVTKYYLSPAKMMGWQGIWGILLLVIFLPIFQYIE